MTIEPKVTQDITRERLIELMAVGETYHRDNPYDYRNEYEISADAILAELQRSRTQATEAAGYKLVPIEPTREMLEAMTLVLEAPYNQANAKHMFKARHVHQAMLKSAPPVVTEHEEAE